MYSLVWEYSVTLHIDWLPKARSTMSLIPPPPCVPGTVGCSLPTAWPWPTWWRRCRSPARCSTARPPTRSWTAGWMSSPGAAETHSAHGASAGQPPRGLWETPACACRREGMCTIRMMEVKTNIQPQVVGECNALIYSFNATFILIFRDL